PNVTSASGEGWREVVELRTGRQLVSGLGCLCAGAGMLDGSVLHDENSVLQQAYVLQRVAVHGGDGGGGPGGGAADPVIPADQFGRMDGGRLDRAERALAAAHLVGELAGVEAVRIYAAVGTECDAHASRQALGEPFSLREGRLVVLGQHVGAPALFAA